MYLDIVAKVIEKAEEQIKIYPQHVNRASSAGHPCKRFLVWSRTKWDKKPKYDVGLQFIFEGGRWIERQAIAELEAAGYQVLEKERPFVWKEMELTGRIDGKIVVNKRPVPIEIKSMSPHIWHKINTMDDMMKATWPWVRHYPAQILLYMMMDNIDLGYFYLKNKVSFMPKAIMVNLYNHLEYTEGILKKLEEVNEAVRKNQTPPPLEKGDDICPRCDFFMMCSPDVALGTETAFHDDTEILNLLEERDALKEFRDRYEEVDKNVKEKLKGTERALIGPYLITGKKIEGFRKPSEGGPYNYWRTTIERIGPTASE